MSAFIARFNPHQMDDETVLALATGRKHALAIALDTLADNREGQGAERQHLLVVGPRGRGKSFFLKYLRIHFERDERFKNCRFISLPEEQSNVRFASDFVRMILSQVTGSGYQSVAAYWREPEELWQKAYTELEDWCRAQLELHTDFLLVVVVENFQDLLERLDETGEHRIRHMMERLPGFVLIGATPFSRVDSDYNRPLFHIFKELQIERWTSEDYLKYFRRRLQNDTSGRVRTPAESRLLEAKLLAISQYTGGSPRMAVVLSNLLLHDNVVGTARTLYGLVDELTPYYQDLTKEIPANSRLLFDALIRLGENLSQSELASKVGATQNEISKAFRWLHENGYVVGAKRLDSKEFRYYVSDRVYVLYYQQREIFHDKNYTPIWLMADFLMEFFAEEGELKREALVSLIVEPSRDSEDLMRVWMRKTGMEEVKYAQERSLGELLKETGVDENDFLSAAADLVDDGKYSRAIEYSNKLLEQKQASHFFYIFLNWVIGRALCGLGEYEDAIEYQNKSCAVSQKVQNIAFQAISLGDIGMNLQGLGRYAESLEANQKAFDLRVKEENMSGQAWNLGQIGWNLEKLGHYAEALEAHQKALDLWVKEENTSEQAWNLGQIGLNLEKLGRYEYALKANQESFDLWMHEGNEDQLAISLEMIGMSLEKLDRFAEALEAHQKAFDFRVKEENTKAKAFNLGQIGWNLDKLGRYTEALEAHQKSFELWAQEGSDDQQAMNLDQIGTILEKFGRYTESLEANQKALDLRVKEENTSGQAWNLGQISWNLEKLGRYVEALEAHQKALDLWVKEEDTSQQAWNLGQIGWNLDKLGRYVEAFEAYQKALDLWVKEKNTSQQAWSLSRIGWSLENLDRYIEAFETYQKASDLWIEEENTSQQAWRLGRIGWCLEKLGRYAEAFEAYQKALNLWIKEEDILSQAWNLGRIGWCHKMLQQFFASINAHQKAIELLKKTEDIAHVAWNLGQIAVNHFLAEQPELAWAVLNELPEQPDEIFKQFGDAVAHKAAWEGQAAAFSLAIQILYGVAERGLGSNVYRYLNLLFVDFITMKVASTLLSDIAEEAKLIFPEADHQAICDAAIHCAGYLETGKSPAYLEKISPDMAILVRAIVDEAE